MPYDQKAHTKLRIDWEKKSEILTECHVALDCARESLANAIDLYEVFGCEVSEKMLLIAQNHFKYSERRVKNSHKKCSIAQDLFKKSCAEKDEQKLNYAYDARLTKAAPDLLGLVEDLLSNLHDQECNDEVIEIVARAKLTIAQVYGQLA